MQTVSSAKIDNMLNLCKFHAGDSMIGVIITIWELEQDSTCITEIILVQSLKDSTLYTGIFYNHLGVKQSTSYTVYEV